jgi:hypothetical protein
MPSEMTKKQVHGTDSVSHSFDEFQLFPKFPIELRLATWGLAVPERNTVTLTGVIGDNPKLIRDWRGDQIVAQASYKVPAILHVNRESRGFAQKYYTRALGEQLGGNAVYINFKTDTLHLEGDRAIRAFYGIPELGPYSVATFAPPSFDYSLVHRETRRLSYAFEGNVRGVIGRISATTRWYLRFFENLETMYFHESVCLEVVQAKMAELLNRLRKEQCEKLRGSSWKDPEVLFLNRDQMHKLVCSSMSLIIELC